jgi:hypothetical protein
VVRADAKAIRLRRRSHSAPAHICVKMMILRCIAAALPRNPMDLNKQLAALTTSELQTAGASQATAIALSVVLRHLRSPELAKLTETAFVNHQSVMQKTPWPDQMLQSFEATRRFLEAAAQPLPADPAGQAGDADGAPD